MPLRAGWLSSRSLLRTTLTGLVFAGLAAAAGGATITVKTAADGVTPNDGVVTLREAITAINAGNDLGDPDITAQTPGTFGTSDTINFSIPGAGVHTIQPTSALPALTKPVTINGFSQPGSSVNMLAVGNNSVHLIEIDGTNAGTLTGGLLQIQGGNSTVKGLVINRAQGGSSAALRVTTAGGNVISGNFIGIDPTGAFARGNGCNGLAVSSANNTIGGLTPADRNVISATGGCGVNLVIGQLGISGISNNVVINNYLGTNAAGTTSLGGSGGATLANGATNNTIGGTTAAARNVISGNSLSGVNVFDAATTGNVIQGNFIGTDATGLLAVPNFNGVQFPASANFNTVGGLAAGAGNVIAFNSNIGIVMSGTPFGVGTPFLGNSIFSNGGLGIDLGNDGVTIPDNCDADTGPNNLQNFPVITSVVPSGGSSTITGTLNSLANQNYRIEFFASPVCNAAPPNDYGEGKTFIGITEVTTNGACTAPINAIIPFDTSGQVVTATATRLVPQQVGVTGPIRTFGIIPVVPYETSEFSQCFQVLGVTPTPTNTLTSSPTSTPTPVTATSTPTPTPTNTRTNTPNPGAGAVVPTLSPWMLAIFGAALAAVAFLLTRRP